MKTCDTCGNDYAEGIDVIRNGESWYFDSFECAIQKLAPVCGHCGCRIIGHGVESEGAWYCCCHCAEKAGAPRPDGMQPAGG